MDDNIETTGFKSPIERLFVIASFICFVSLVFIYWVARPVVKLLGVWWVELLAYSIIPISVTFIILYRSRWHPEITGARRTSSLLLLSCVILIGVLFATGIVFCAEWLCWVTFYGGH